MLEVIKQINQRFIDSQIVKGLTFSTETISVGIMWLFTCSALIGISLGYAEWFIPKTPLNLLICLVLLLINIPLISNKSKGVFIIAFIVGMVIEIAGVTTGQIFGRYEYGNNLGVKFWGVPLMIGVYWAVLVIVTSQIAKSYFKNIFYVSITGAFLMVGLDFLMEQMAASFDFWYFEGGIASIKNYIAWFIVSFILQLLAYNWIPKIDGHFSTQLYLNQIVFFSISFILL
ncbi:MAG: putative membrane protein [Saprospiraceae bacterium]|jgi:putative membrane protein